MCTQSHTRKYTHTNIQTHITDIHTHTGIYTRTNAQTHADTQAFTHTHTTHTHAHTHRVGHRCAPAAVGVVK